MPTNVQREVLSPIRDCPSGSKEILWIILAMALFVSVNTCTKYLGQNYSTVQIVWARYFFHLILLSFILRQRLPSFIVTKRIILQLIRSGLLLLTTTLHFTSLQFIPLAEASAIFMTVPIIVTALSVPIIGEPVGPRRRASVFIGFATAIVMIRPVERKCRWFRCYP